MYGLYAGSPRGRAIHLSKGLELINSVDSIKKGIVRIFGFPEVHFNPDNFTWGSIEAHELAGSHRFYLHSLNWIDILVDEGLKNGDYARSVDSARLARNVAEQWIKTNENNPSWGSQAAVWGGHAVAIRSTTLVALSEVFPDVECIRDSLQEHMKHLTDHFDGYWNHGLAQALALIATAFRLGDNSALAIGADRAKRCVDAMIDDEGAINEQAPGYCSYVERLTRLTISTFKTFQLSGVEEMESKIPLLREFAAHATQPNGQFIELGDTSQQPLGLISGEPSEYLLSNGSVGKKIPRVKIYKRGFAFRRSGFGNLRPQSDETYYSLRFGPGRKFHGHNDHMNVTQWASGRKVITDPGHIGYERGNNRSYTLAHKSHNVPFVRNREFSSSAETKLIQTISGRTWSTFLLRDRAFSNVTRRRTVCFVDRGPFAVLDFVTAEPGEALTLSQGWNIAPEFELENTLNDAVIFRSGVDGGRLYLIKIAVDSDGLVDPSDTGNEFHYGDRTEMLGWTAQGRELLPSWHVFFNNSDTSRRIITLGFFCDIRSSVSWSSRTLSVGRFELVISSGVNEWVFHANSRNLKIVLASGPKLKNYANGGLPHFQI